jgi:hypothetical protein
LNELLLKVDVVRVDEHELGDTVTFALETGRRFTIRQDSGNIADEASLSPSGRAQQNSGSREQPLSVAAFYFECVHSKKRHDATKCRDLEVGDAT